MAVERRGDAADDHVQSFATRELAAGHERECKYAEGITEISPGLERSDYPGKPSRKFLPLRVRFGSEWGEGRGEVCQKF